MLIVLDVPFRALCWIQVGRPRRCKITVFLLILKMKGVPEAATKWIQKSKNCKIYKENQCFSRMPRGALWRPLRVVIFLSPILRPQDGPGERIIFIEKPMVLLMFLQKSRSHAAWRSFGSAPPRRHASVSGI